LAYSIRDLEKLSGIKAHTIRIWEQRYKIIEPKRTATNIRYYTDDDLQYLLNIAFLNRNGMRISKISKLSRTEIADKVASISQDSQEQTHHLQNLTMAMIELNEYKFEQTIQTCMQADGFEKTVQQLIVPFLEKLSLLWFTGSISTVHEHFINNLIQQKITTQLALLPVPEPNSELPRVLLFGPLGENQEVLLLLINYFLRLRGCLTLYLGINIPTNDLETAIQLFGPSHIFTTFTDNNNKHKLHKFLQALSQAVSPLPIFASTHALSQDPPLPNNITLFDEFNELVEFMQSL